MIEINKVYCENNLETMARMPDGFIDLVVTSPPYDDFTLEFEPIPRRGMRQYEGYTWDFKAIAHELYRVTKDGGVVVWIVGDPTIDGSESLASSLQKIYFRRVGFSIHDTMFYGKSGTPPLNHRRYEQAIEYMFILSKGSPKTFNAITEKTINAGKMTTGTMRNSGSDKLSKKHGHGLPVKQVRTKDNIWWYQVGKNKTTKDDFSSHPAVHPAMFPEQLAVDHIVSWSNPGDLVFDPFLGSGTTAKMAILNNRNFIGSEIAPEYAPIYEKRIADALAQMSKAPRIVESGNTTYSIPPLFAE